MDKRRIKYGIAAFIDILGFSEKVSGVGSENDLAAIEKTVGFVQGEFEYRPKDQLQKSSHKIIEKTVLAFTDCLIIFVPAKSRATQSSGSFDVLVQEIDSLGLGQGSCVLNGHFLRGGVAQGYWYKKKDTLISSAQVAAYKIESKDVLVPMVGIAEDLYRLLETHPGRRFYSSDIEPLKRIIIERPHPETSKPMWLINYFRICLESVGEALTAQERAELKSATPDRRDEILSNAHYRTCVEFADQHRKVVENALNAAPAGRIKAKYEWLANYHNDVIKTFFKQPPSHLLITI